MFKRVISLSLGVLIAFNMFATLLPAKINLPLIKSSQLLIKALMPTNPLFEIIFFSVHLKYTTLKECLQQFCYATFLISLEEIATGTV